MPEDQQTSTEGRVQKRGRGSMEQLAGSGSFVRCTRNDERWGGLIAGRAQTIGSRVREREAWTSDPCARDSTPTEGKARVLRGRAMAEAAQGNATGQPVAEWVERKAGGVNGGMETRSARREKKSQEDEEERRSPSIRDADRPVSGRIQALPEERRSRYQESGVHCQRTTELVRAECRMIGKASQPTEQGGSGAGHSTEARRRAGISPSSLQGEDIGGQSRLGRPTAVWLKRDAVTGVQEQAGPQGQN